MTKRYQIGEKIEFKPRNYAGELIQKDFRGKVWEVIKVLKGPSDLSRIVPWKFVAKCGDEVIRFWEGSEYWRYSRRVKEKKR
jgi:hypothetical protein